MSQFMGDAIKERRGGGSRRRGRPGGRSSAGPRIVRCRSGALLLRIKDQRCGIFRRQRMQHRTRLSGNRLGLQSLQKIPDGLVALGGNERQVDAGQPALERELAECGDHLVLDALPERPAAEQKGVHAKRLAGALDQYEAHQAVIAESIRDLHRERLAAITTQELPKLGLAAAPGGGVELVGPFGELRGARE